MKKILVGFSLFLSLSLSAQTKLGLKVAPVIVSNRVSNDAQTVDDNGTDFKFSVGLTVDRLLSESYFISSGLIFIPKSASFRAGADSTETYKLQYLQIPLTLKLFTGEIAPDMKLYFQVGGGLEFKVFEEADEPDYEVIESFDPLDFSVILGSGIEYRVGANTLFGGLSYQRALANVVSNTISGAESLDIRNTVFSIDLGIKF